MATSPVPLSWLSQQCNVSKEITDRPLCKVGETREDAKLERFDVLTGNVGKQSGNQFVDIDAFRFRVERRHDSMSKYGMSQGFDIVDRDVVSIVKEGSNLRRQNQLLTRTRPRAPTDQLRDPGQRLIAAWARGSH
jgi:hypothetical protein